MIKSRNTPQSLPSQRRHMLEGQDGPWSVSVAETPNDPQSFTLYIKTPTHNLTLIRAAFELVELDEKLHDAHPQVKKPKLPAALFLIPMPPKRKSAFLNTLSRLASPGVKLSPAKQGHGSRRTSNPSTTNNAPNNSVASPTNGTSNLSSSVSSPSNELNDPFSQVMSDVDTSTLVPPNNPTITNLAAYLTSIANDQIHRQTRIWRRFVRVRTDDLESVRVERAIKRVRSDLAAHLKRPSADLPGPVSISTSLSKDDGDTVIVTTTESSPLAPELSPTAEVSQKPVEEIPPPVKVSDETPNEQTVLEDVTAEVQKPKGTPEEPKAEVSSSDSKDDENSTPIASETHTARIPRSQSAGPTTRHRKFMASPLAGREGTLSQTSETTEDDESSVVSETKKYGNGSRAGRKKRARSVDPNRELKKQSKKVAIDDFEMMRVLGKGCAGKVLLVRHKPTSDLFALKAITKRHVLAHQELQHTLTEQAVLKRMAAEGKDPFVVKLWWSFHDREHLFLVMDFHPGGDLATQLARWGRLGRDRARFYAAEIVEGVEGLHNNGVIYRDLKPENVLIGSDGHIVLTDFGLSKEFPRRSNAATAPPTPNGTRGESFANGVPSSPDSDKDLGPTAGIETTSTFCGTAEYLAPEVIQGLPYSFEVDWWSFGTMLYEMLTGITPFWANNHSDMYLRVLQDELQFPEDRSMDQDTKSLIRGLLQRNPALRIKEPRIKRHPYFSMIDWSHVSYKRYIPPYIPPIDPSNAGDTQNFDETFLDMEPVVKDADDADDQTDTDQDRQTDTDRTEGEDSVATPCQSRSPSVHASEPGVDVFDGYSFKGRHSVLIDDEENSDFDDDGEYEEDEEEDASVSKSPTSDDTKDRESTLADVEDQAVETETEEERRVEPRTPEARPAPLRAEVPVEETKTDTGPTQPTHTAEPSAPPKRPSVEIPRPSNDSQRSEVSSKSGKPPIPPKSSNVPRSSKQAGKRREKSGIAALDKHLGEGIDDLTEREEEDEWDMVEAGVDEEHNGAKGTSLFARGVVDRYKLAVFRKSTTSRHGNRKTPKVSGPDPGSPSPSEKQNRGRTPLSFRNKKNILKTPPHSLSSRTSGTSKQNTLNSVGSSSIGTSTTALNRSSATNATSPSLRSKQSAVSMTSPSESDFSPNDDTTRPGVLGGEAFIRKPVPQSPTDERKKKKKLKGAEKVLSIFS